MRYLVGLAGDVEGRVLFDMSMETALNIASKMNDEKIDTFDELAKATITELANLITAQAVTKLHELGFKLILRHLPYLQVRGWRFQIKMLSFNCSDDNGAR